MVDRGIGKAAGRHLTGRDRHVLASCKQEVRGSRPLSGLKSNLQTGRSWLSSRLAGRKGGTESGTHTRRGPAHADTLRATG